MHETIIVIFIFLVILAAGMIFFYKFQLRSIQIDQENYQMQQFENVLLTIPCLPEVECSFYGVTEDCIDVSKLLAFQVVSKKNKEYYKKQLGFKKIIIEQVYPFKNANRCTLNNMDDCGVWDVYENPRGGSKLIIESPISLYFPKSDSYGVGLLKVEEYNV